MKVLQMMEVLYLHLHVNAFNFFSMLIFSRQGMCNNVVKEILHSDTNTWNKVIFRLVD